MNFIINEIRNLNLSDRFNFLKNIPSGLIYNDNLFLLKNNGSIINIETLKYICKPEYHCSKQLNYAIIKMISNNINDYNFYQLVDGTIFNLYYYNDQWNLGSLNGYDVKNLKYTSNKTFLELFTDALVNEYPNVDLSKFDKTKTYTITLQHPEMHFTANEKKLFSFSDNIKEFSQVNISITFNDKDSFLKTAYACNKIDNLTFGLLIYNKKIPQKSFILCTKTWNIIKTMLYSRIPNPKSKTPEQRYRYIMMRSYIFSTLSDYTKKIFKLFTFNNNNKNNVNETKLFIKFMNDYKNKLLNDNSTDNNIELDINSLHFVKKRINDLISDIIQTIRMKKKNESILLINNKNNEDNLQKIINIFADSIYKKINISNDLLFNSISMILISQRDINHLNYLYEYIWYENK